MVVRRCTTLAVWWLGTSSVAAQGANAAPAQSPDQPVVATPPDQNPRPDAHRAAESWSRSATAAAASDQPSPSTPSGAAQAPAQTPTTVAAPDRRAPSRPPDAAQAPTESTTTDGTLDQRPLTTAETSARLAFERGLAALREQRWAEAEAEFRRSFALVPRASTAYDLALVLFEQRRFRASAECLQRLLHSEIERAGLAAERDSADRAYAEALLARVLPQLSTLRLSVAPSHAQVQIDAESVALSGPEQAIPLDPGAHHVDVTATGFAADSFEVTATAGSELRRDVRLMATPNLQLAAAAQHEAPESSPLSASGPWLTMGLGAALLVGAALTGLAAEHADDAFSRSCPSHRNCDPSLKSKRDEVVTLGAASDILLVSGGGLVAGGVAWRLLIGTPGQRDAGSASVLLTASVTHF